VPLSMQDYAMGKLFGNAISAAYAFKGLYTDTDSLENGVGYWLKFGQGEEIQLNGINREVDSFKVIKGWNLVGSASVPIPVKGITTVPGGMVASQFFGFSDAYAAADTIRSGQGYWVKVDVAGMLILSATPSMEAASRIRIVETSELPPAPPWPRLDHGVSMPNTYALAQNYPNPFNPSTTIIYVLPSTARVRLVVFNVLGQPVATLVDGVVSGGSHEVVWNASVNPSGIYYYRIDASESSAQARTFMAVKKFLLLR
jgi:hypothetical protein